MVTLFKFLKPCCQQFGEESSHLRCLNPFIVKCHEKMKELFRRCCRGPTLEEYFAVDEYTEATLLHHPHIYITVQVFHISIVWTCSGRIPKRRDALQNNKRNSRLCGTSIQYLFRTYDGANGRGVR